MNMKKKLTIPVILIMAVVISVGFYVLKKPFSSSVSKPQNVLIVSIDTCRADFLSCYGFPLKTTPVIDAIAQDSMVFDRAISPLPFTLPAHCSMMTGKVPPQHGVLDNGLYTLSKENITLAEILKEQGFSTAAFVSASVLDTEFGMAQGFDTYDDEFDDERNTMGIPERLGGNTTDLTIQWIERHKTEQQFVFVHLYDPHFTYDAPEPFASKFPDAKKPELLPDIPPNYTDRCSAYAGEIGYVDHCIGRIIGKLKELDRYDNTLIIITSDHGEMLGQHGESTHGYFTYQGNIRVPLVIRVPGKEKHLLVKGPVGIIDIVPTVCSALSTEIHHKIDGKDLLAYYNDTQPYPDRYVFSQSLEPTKYKANPLLTVITDQHNYTLTTHSELFDLNDDPYENDNLVQEQAKRAHLMQGRLLDILDRISKNKTESGEQASPEIIQKLESLGYIGSPVDETLQIDPEKYDPKELIKYHVMGGRVGYFVQNEKFDIAEKLCKELIDERPEQYIGYQKMGRCLMEQEKYSEGIKYYQKVTEIDPGNVKTFSDISRAYYTIEEYDDAIEYARESLDMQDDLIQAYYYLCASRYGKGIYDDPMEYLTESIKDQPSYSRTLVELAEKLLEKRQIKRAYDKYVEVLRVEPESLDGLNSIAWLQAASTIKGIRNPQQALDYAIKARDVSEVLEPEVLDTLAVAYAATGDYENAIKSANEAIQLANSKDKKPLAGRIQKRMKLYEKKQPFIDSSLR